MKLLITDRTSEGQMTLARIIDQFDQADVDGLDLSVSLTSEHQLSQRLPSIEVLLLGPGLEDDGLSIARASKAAFPELQIISCVSKERYSKEAFRAAYANGIRTVVSIEASSLDLLQELIKIREGFLLEGKASVGKLIAVSHPKGGVGATTLSAALGEVSASGGRRTLLWDMDWKTKDLSRGMNVSVQGGAIVRRWVEGAEEPTRDAFRSSLAKIGKNLNVLVPPDSLASSIDMMVHPEGVRLSDRLIEFSRLSHDTVIVDTGGELLSTRQKLFSSQTLLVM